MGWDNIIEPSLSGYDKHGVPYSWFGYSLFLWEGLWELGGILAIRPGVAATFWNRLVAFGLFGIILEYFGKALLGGWIDCERMA